MEKIKDILHDYTDIILAVAIASIMFIAVGWNLGSWFTGGSTAIAAENPSIVEAPQGETTPQEPVKEEPPLEENATDEQEEEPAEEQPAQEETATPTPDTPISSPEVTVVEVKKITIPSGTPGIGIARILLQEGLIENTAQFIEAAERLNLALRLKSGTFDISTDTSIDDMVKIIAEVKR